MLHHVAEGEEKALATYIDRLMTLLTPLLTIALGLFVGGIVMSIMRAILSVNELVAK
jgi:general secretion pathway protein F